MDNPLKLTALTSDMLVRLLKQVGCRSVSEEPLAADIEAGAPVNPDGTFNLINYAAWLAKEASDDQSE
jgi:hypothetical protein